MGRRPDGLGCLVGAHRARAVTGPPATRTPGPNTGGSEGVQGGSATRYTGHLGLARQLLLMHPHTLQGVQVDEHVDQGILVDNGGLAAQPGPLDAEFNGLAIGALVGGALLVDRLVLRACAVELVTQAHAHAGRHHRGAAAFGPGIVANMSAAVRYCTSESRPMCTSHSRPMCPGCGHPMCTRVTAPLLHIPYPYQHNTSCGS